MSISLLYIMGNLQNFTVETQSMLLQAMQIVGYGAVGINVYALLMLVLWGFRHHTVLGWRIAFALISLLVGLFLTLGASFIGLLLKPNW